MNPNGSESINLQLVEKLTVGQDQAWVRLPDLQKRRQVSILSCLERGVMYPACSRRQLGCAVVRDAAGHLGLVAVGGTGDTEQVSGEQMMTMRMEKSD